LQYLVRKLILLTSLAIPLWTAQQQQERTLLLEVISSTYDIHRTETLVFLRVFSDGTAEAHPSGIVDFRKVTLKQAHVPTKDFDRLRAELNSPQTRALRDNYERSWGAIDFGSKWTITIRQGEQPMTITLMNFQPFLARAKKNPILGSSRR